MDNLHILRRARTVRDYFGIPVPIKDIYALVDKLGGRIELSKQLPRYSTGIISRDVPYDNFVIRYPHRTNNKHFLQHVVRLLGHLFLHMGYYTDYPYWMISPPHPTYCFPHNFADIPIFVSEFITPSEYFVSTFNRYKLTDRHININGIARHFNINYNFILSRAKYLDLLPDDYVDIW